MDLLGGNPESENPESDSQSVEGERGGKTQPDPKAEGALAGTFAMAAKSYRVLVADWLMSNNGPSVLQCVIGGWFG
jgi:hypothetical protein